MLSTLTPSTSASSVSNAFISLTKQACSLVHVGLQSSGYHTSTTFFFPTKSESFTSFFSWFNSVKSGAVCPTAMLIFFPPVVLKSRQVSYQSRKLPTNRRSHPGARQRNGGRLKGGFFCLFLRHIMP